MWANFVVIMLGRPQVEETRKKHSLEANDLRADIALLTREKRQHQKASVWGPCRRSVAPAALSGGTWQPLHREQVTMGNATGPAATAIACCHTRRMRTWPPSPRLPPRRLAPMRRMSWSG